MDKAVFCKLMTQMQRNTPGNGGLHGEMVVKLRSGEGSRVSWGLSLPYWSSRTQKDSLSQNQGKLEALGPPNLNPDLILLPCGELSELQLPSEGPSQSHPPSVVPAWAWYHLRAIKKKKKDQKMLLLRTWAKRIEWESTREWSCPEPRGISAYRLIWQACILTLSLLHTLKAQSLRLPNGIPLALLSQTYIWFVPLDSPDKFVKLSTLPLNFFFTSTKSQCSDQRRGSHIHLFTIAIRLAASPQHPPKGVLAEDTSMNLPQLPYL